MRTILILINMYNQLVYAFMTDSKYDLIHFNHGLHGIHLSKKSYKSRMNKLLSKIDKDVKLILATSTIVYREGNKRLDGAWMKRVRERNAAVQEIAEEKGGYGWWGNNANRDFYVNLKAADSPWNRIRTVRIPYTKNGKGGDHAGVYESSMLEYLYPESIKMDRLKDSNDWFAETAKAIDVRIGEEMTKVAVDDIIALITEK